MDAREAFLEAQQQMPDRYGIDSRSEYLQIPSIEGRAHVLISGEGPALVLINGIGTPAAMWAPVGTLRQR